MKKFGKRLLLLVMVILIAMVTAAGWYLYKAIPIGTGYTAKYICSAVFLSGRDPQEVFQTDVAPVNILTKIIEASVDREKKSVTAVALGMMRSTAVYRPGCGCTLVVGTDAETILASEDCGPAALALPENLEWPLGQAVAVRPVPEGVDLPKIEAAVERAFTETGVGKPVKTRAVVVVYDGQLLAEKYAPGFDRHTVLPGWSMSKSVTNAMVGILVRKGQLDIHQPAKVAEWQADNDPRKQITLDQLLRMSSGLQFEEVYDPLYDATNMLYGSYDFAAYAAVKPLKAKPDEKWYYSSGTANIVSRIVRQSLPEPYTEVMTFARKELFDKLGMSSIVLEKDPSGTIVGSSYGNATARDWARFGLLYLQDGVFNGERILPEGWVAYSATPTKKAPKGEYGAHFWLNAGTGPDPATRPWPNLPEDTFFAIGYQEQTITVIPSRKVVIVRLGLTVDRSKWNRGAFVESILAGVP